MKIIENNVFDWEVVGVVPSMKNDLRVSRFGGLYHKGNEVAAYKQAFALQTPGGYKRAIDKPVYVYTVIYQKDRRKDGHNAQAVIFDALEFAGVIKNDRLVESWGGEVKLDKENPRVAVMVKEL